MSRPAATPPPTSSRSGADGYPTESQPDSTDTTPPPDDGQTDAQITTTASGWRLGVIAGLVVIATLFVLGIHAGASFGVGLVVLAGSGALGTVPAGTTALQNAGIVVAATPAP
jgi:hypothetical protein